MTIERIQPILQDISTRIEELDEILFLQKDGTVLAQFSVNAQEGIPVSIITEFAELVDNVSQAVEQGKGKEALIKGKKRFFGFVRDPFVGCVPGDTWSANRQFRVAEFRMPDCNQKIEELYNE